MTTRPHKRPPRPFDIQAEAQRLFRSAEARGDFNGAASVLRLLKDLVKENADARVGQPAPGLDVSLLNEEEFAELGELLDMLDRLKARVNARQATEAQPIATRSDRVG